MSGQRPSPLLAHLCCSSLRLAVEVASATVSSETALGVTPARPASPERKMVCLEATNTVALQPAQKRREKMGWQAVQANVLLSLLSSRTH